MKFYSGLMLLLFIEPYLLAPMDTVCPKLDQRALFSEQALMNMVDGGGGSCDHHCNGRRRRSINSISFCEQQHENRIRARHLGMKHLYSELTTLHHSIQLGGYWTIPDFLWNPANNDRCNLQTVDMCRPEFWVHHHGIRISCFENELAVSSWSQKILNTTHNLQKIVPNTETDFESLLPFPNLFNVTIVNVEKSQVCHKSNTTVCHRRMHINEDSQCSLYLCHTTNSAELYNITFRYEPTNTLVSMLVMCHALTNEQIKEYQTVPEDTMCHFLTPQANFFLCDNK